VEFVVGGESVEDVGGGVVRCRMLLLLMCSNATGLGFGDAIAAASFELVGVLWVTAFVLLGNVNRPLPRRRASPLSGTRSSSLLLCGTLRSVHLATVHQFIEGSVHRGSFVVATVFRGGRERWDGGWVVWP